MLYLLKCGDVSGDGNNITKETIIEMDGNDSDFSLALTKFAKLSGVDIRNEFQIDNRIEKEKIFKIYEHLGRSVDLDDSHIHNESLYFHILIEEYFELLINIVMFINPGLNIKMKQYKTLGMDSYGLTAGW